MKIAILSDIHSNLEALSACYDRAIERGAEKFVCLGDSIGYGADPCPTMDMILSLPGLVAVIGNHDEYVILEKLADVSVPVKESAEWTRKQLRQDHLDFLGALPYQVVENGVTYVHASASNPYEWEYLLDEKKIWKCMEAADTSLVFIGHVHIPAIYREIPASSAELVTPEADKEFSLVPKLRHVINVGSVGQPRDDDNRASFVIYDDQRDSVIFQRVSYDYSETGRKIREAGMNPFFAERLTTGR
jgi:diadenosine tetraphosphatase ApaH/serine/threonine PP2A family protein phosphatase